jgi:hypothetical protein
MARSGPIGQRVHLSATRARRRRHSYSFRYQNETKFRRQMAARDQNVDVSFIGVMGGSTDREMSKEARPPSVRRLFINKKMIWWRSVHGPVRASTFGQAFQRGAAIRPELFIRTNWIGHRQRDVRFTRPQVHPPGARNCSKMAPVLRGPPGRCPEWPPGGNNPPAPPGLRGLP